MEINLYKKTSEIISAEKYLKLTDKEKSNIESAKIIAPKLGDTDFGMIQITYRLPVFNKNIFLS